MSLLPLGNEQTLLFICITVVPASSNKEVPFSVLTRREEETTCSVLCCAQRLPAGTSSRGERTQCHRALEGVWPGHGELPEAEDGSNSVCLCLAAHGDIPSSQGLVALKSVVDFAHGRDGEFWRVSVKSAAPPLH